MRVWPVTRRPRSPQPDGRPIEAIAADVRRLHARFHALQPRTPFVKVEAIRGAYDHVLSECCEVLGIVHLLGVLRPGPEIDAERARVEQRLSDAGVRLTHHG
jgi:hypothetical protein